MMLLECLRKTQNLTYSNLAEIAGITKSAVFLLAKGKTNPSFKVATKLASYFNTPVERLFSEDIPESEKVAVMKDDDKSSKTSNDLELMTAREIAEKIFKN